MFWTLLDFPCICWEMLKSLDNLSLLMREHVVIGLVEKWVGRGLMPSDHNFSTGTCAPKNIHIYLKVDNYNINYKNQRWHFFFLQKSKSALIIRITLLVTWFHTNTRAILFIRNAKIWQRKDIIMTHEVWHTYWRWKAILVHVPTKWNINITVMDAE